MCVPVPSRNLDFQRHTVVAMGIVHEKLVQVLDDCSLVDNGGIYQGE
jgi:hypothetical protein